MKRSKSPGQLPLLGAEQAPGPLLLRQATALDTSGSGTPSKKVPLDTAPARAAVGAPMPVQPAAMTAGATPSHAVGRSSVGTPTALKPMAAPKAHPQRKPKTGEPPGCATCGNPPWGTFPDGSPSYSCHHEPLLEDPA